MITLEVIQQSLDLNTLLSSDVKENIWELIVIFNKRFPDVNLAVLNDKIKTLQIKKGSKFLIKNSSTYNVVENTIYINNSKISDTDCKFVLMREILNVITVKDNYTGFNINNQYEALNIGYTETLANFLVGNETDSEYQDEVSVVSMLSLILGDDSFYQAYFNNDINKILSVIS